MPIVTLTTDYGSSDHYVAALKGQLLKSCPKIDLYDISHEVKPFDTIGASFIIKNAALVYPEGTIHLVIINIKEGNNRYLLIEKDRQLIVCPDNGIVSLMFPDEKFKAYVLPHLELDFSYRELLTAFAKMYQSLLAGTSLGEVAKPTTSYITKVNMRPIVSEDMIRGAVFYVDKFGNSVTNITKEMFEKMVGDKHFIIGFRHYKLERLSKHYSDVPIGDALCIINEAGFLEIAINQGNISTLLDMNYGANVMVELY